MDYKFIADLLADVNVPTEGILSRVLQKDDHVNITLFGFSPGPVSYTHLDVYKRQSMRSVFAQPT